MVWEQQKISSGQFSGRRDAGTHWTSNGEREGVEGFGAAETTANARPPPFFAASPLAFNLNRTVSRPPPITKTPRSTPLGPTPLSSLPSPNTAIAEAPRRKKRGHPRQDDSDSDIEILSFNPDPTTPVSTPRSSPSKASTKQKRCPTSAPSSPSTSRSPEKRSRKPPPTITEFWQKDKRLGAKEIQRQWRTLATYIDRLREAAEASPPKSNVFAGFRFLVVHPDITNGNSSPNRIDAYLVERLGELAEFGANLVKPAEFVARSPDNAEGEEWTTHIIIPQIVEHLRMPYLNVLVCVGPDPGGITTDQLGDGVHVVPEKWAWDYRNAVKRGEELPDPKDYLLRDDPRHAPVASTSPKKKKAKTKEKDGKETVAIGRWKERATSGEGADQDTDDESAAEGNGLVFLKLPTCRDCSSTHAKPDDLRDAVELQQKELNRTSDVALILDLDSSAYPSWRKPSTETSNAAFANKLRSIVASNDPTTLLDELAPGHPFSPELVERARAPHGLLVVGLCAAEARNAGEDEAPYDLVMGGMRDVMASYGVDVVHVNLAPQHIKPATECAGHYCTAPNPRDAILFNIAAQALLASPSPSTNSSTPPLSENEIVKNGIRVLTTGRWATAVMGMKSSMSQQKVEGLPDARGWSSLHFGVVSKTSPVWLLIGISMSDILANFAESSSPPPQLANDRPSPCTLLDKLWSSIRQKSANHYVAKGLPPLFASLFEEALDQPEWRFQSEDQARRHIENMDKEEVSMLSGHVRRMVREG